MDATVSVAMNGRRHSAKNARIGMVDAGHRALSPCWSSSARCVVGVHRHLCGAFDAGSEMRGTNARIRSARIAPSVGAARSTAADGLRGTWHSPMHPIDLHRQLIAADHRVQQQARDRIAEAGVQCLRNPGQVLALAYIDLQAGAGAELRG